MSASLSTDLDDADAVPYFLWDDPITTAEFRRRLVSAAPPERARMLGKLLREARDTDVWRFTNPVEVVTLWPRIEPYLGLRRGFWSYLLGRWRSDGLLDQ